MIRQQVFDSLKWTTSARLLIQLIRWMTTFYVIRILTPNDYGLVSAAEVFFEFLMMFSATGIGASIIRAEKLSDRVLSEAFTAILLLNVALAGAQWIVADWVAVSFQKPQVALILRVTALSFLLSAFEVIPNAMLTRDMRFKSISLAELSANVGLALTVLVLAMQGYGFYSLILGGLVLTALRTVLKLWQYGHWHWPAWGLSEGRGVIIYGGSLTILSLLWYLYTYIDMILGSRLMSTTELGIYAVAIQISTMPINKLMPILLSVALPAYSKIQNYPEKIWHYFLKSQRLLFQIFVPLYFGIAATAPVAIPLIIGDKWADSIFPIECLALVMPLKVSMSLFGTPLNALGRVRVLMVNSVLAVILMGGALLYAIRYGILGFATSWLLMFPIVYGITMTLTCRSLGYKAVDLVRELYMPFLNGSLMYLVLLWIRSFISNQFGLMAQCVFLILSGLLIYEGLAWIWDRSPQKELFSLIYRDGRL